MEQNITKSGEIHLQVKALLKSSWVKKYSVLHGKTAEQHGYMEMFDDFQAFQNSQTKGKKCTKIDLHLVKGIKTSRESTSKGTEYQIEIKLKSQKYLLMCDKEADFNDWFAKLNAAADIAERGSAEGSSVSVDLEDSDTDDDEVIVLNQMYASTEQAQRFLVEVESSDLAKLCGIEGKMTLLVSNSELAFEDPNTKRIKYAFQLAWMRRFGKYKTHNFNFEVGRKCPNGQGNITCTTEHAKAIHKLVTAKSSSRSKTVIPHPHNENDLKENRPRSKGSPSPPEEKQTEQLPPLYDRQTGVSSPVPVSVPTLGKRHPGQKNLPNLIPIKQVPEGGSSAPMSPLTPPERRGSKSKSRTKGLVNEANNGHLRSTSYKVAVGLSSTFTKELEEKLLDSPNPLDVGKDHEPKKEDSIKTKDEKKREKEEKKRREKEEKKEREREERERKQREKEEKEREEKERKQREKEEKKLSKIKDAEKSKSRTASVKQGSNIYDEPELLTPTTPASEHDDEGGGPLYDEARSPKENIPVEYAQSLKRSGNTREENEYDDGSSTRISKITTSDHVEYAEPYVKKGRVPVKQQPMTYSDIATVEKEAWKKYGTEEKFHQEDYGNIKRARDQKNKEPPPVPVKTYNDDDNADNDDTYDKVGLRNSKKVIANTANLYGAASSKAVGDLSEVVLVPEPEPDYEGNSKGETVEENMYDDPQYDDYTVANNVQTKQNNVVKISDTYEEAVKPVPKTAPPKKSRNEVLYEEVS